MAMHQQPAVAEPAVTGATAVAGWQPRGSGSAVYPANGSAVAGDEFAKSDFEKEDEKAHEFCSCKHLQRTRLGPLRAQEIAVLLGLPDWDTRWCTPWGEDVTYLCHRSEEGGFSSMQWTIDGWILDDTSMQILQKEFPHECLQRPENR